MFDKLIIGFGSKVLGQVANQAGDAIGKQIKDSGVINSAIDSAAVAITKDTKYAKIMKCKFCGSEYDNTCVNCPNCGAPNENRKYDYNKEDKSKSSSILLKPGDIINIKKMNQVFEVIRADSMFYHFKTQDGREITLPIATTDLAVNQGAYEKL